MGELVKALTKVIASAVDAEMQKFKTEERERIRKAADEAIKTQREIRQAENVVRPFVGALELMFDSPEEVYETALRIMSERKA